MVFWGLIISAARLFGGRSLTLVTGTAKIKGLFGFAFLNIFLFLSRFFYQLFNFLLELRGHFSVIVNQFRPEGACEVHRVEVLSKVELCIDSLRASTKLSQLVGVSKIRIIVVRDHTSCMLRSFFLGKEAN